VDGGPPRSNGRVLFVPHNLYNQVSEAEERTDIAQIIVFSSRPKRESRHMLSKILEVDALEILNVLFPTPPIAEHRQNVTSILVLFNRY
jgi:hypothetical protein